MARAVPTTGEQGLNEGPRAMISMPKTAALRRLPGDNSERVPAIGLLPENPQYQADGCERQQDSRIPQPVEERQRPVMKIAPVAGAGIPPGITGYTRVCCRSAKSRNNLAARRGSVRLPAGFVIGSRASVRLANSGGRGLPTEHSKLPT